VPNPDRLTALDSAFLHIETGAAHMHVASIMVFEGEAPAYEDVLRTLDERLHLVPRYRQKLAWVPWAQGRPVWVDDPHFNLGYHVRHSALPAPGSDEQLAALGGRVFAVALDRHKPLWEIQLVEGLAPGPDGTPRFAMMAKTHHALVEGVSGVDITSVLFSTTPDPLPVAPPASAWIPRPEPTGTQLLAGALLERASSPAEGLRALRALGRAPRSVARRVGSQLAAAGTMAWAGMQGAPDTPLNVPIGPHRRFGWVDVPLDVLKGTKNGLGGTVNDAVLTVVALTLGRFLRRRGVDTDGLVLKVMVPVSVRATDQRGALGNKVSAIWAPLPMDLDDPKACFERIHTEMGDLKASGQAVGAEVLTGMADFAPPTIFSQAARLQARQRFFNLVVTNVPGPQIPLYLLGRRMLAIYPVVPLAPMTALGIAIMSYSGRISFGLMADYDAIPDLGDLVTDMEGALFDLGRAAETERHPWRMHERGSVHTAHTPDAAAPAA
jgi:diacylglycerol O-acyltransferase